MKPKTSATLLLFATLVAGILLGALGAGALAERRQRVRADLARPGGFVAHMEELLEPQDEAQREQILPVLEATDAVNRSIVEGARDAMRRELNRMRATLEPLLDVDQLERLDRAIRRPPAGPPPGLGPAERRPGRPPPGR